jgi:hypothetical protein
MRILDDDEAIYSHWTITEASAKDRVPPLRERPFIPRRSKCGKHRPICDVRFALDNENHNNNGVRGRDVRSFILNGEKWRASVKMGTIIIGKSG